MEVMNNFRKEQIDASTVRKALYFGGEQFRDAKMNQTIIKKGYRLAGKRVVVGIVSQR